ncbi:MAG: hypothetical protein ACM3QZ_14785 [Solirubrobacterales bacterium]
MPCGRYILYLAWNQQKYRLGISANPQIDLSFLRESEGYENLAYISPPMPLAFSERLLTLCASPQERIGKQYRPFIKIPFFVNQEIVIRSILKRKAGRVKKELANFDEHYLAGEPVVYSQSTANIDYYSLNYYEDIVEYILQGRIYYLHEIARRLKDRNLETEDLEVILHLLTLKGLIVRVPSVKLNVDGSMACNRCGHEYRVVKTYCERGRKECFMCQECLMLGESKPCDALYAAVAKAQPEEGFVKSVRLSLDISFSQPQYEAFETLTRFIRKDSLTECLVLEACGAGRPEVVYGAVREVLKRGGRVLFGVLRRDYLEDMALRLERAFPGAGLVTSTGNRTWERNGDIILATTHQAMKYYKRFDLVILDESETFPHRANPMLINALRRARKNEGKFIYLTPTPTPEVYAMSQRGLMKVVQIPGRPHGKPLVVPRVVLEKELANDTKIPEQLLHLIRETLEEDKAQGLIIVPDADRARRVGEQLMHQLELLPLQGLTGEPVAWTDARDPLRDKKVASFIKGEHNILVTTNLTRRGDRAPNSNLVVLWADREIFDEGLLVQLAGRVGWSDAYPSGKVWFVTSRQTREIEGAIRKIKLLNEEAQKKGYLDNVKQKKNARL